MGVDRPPVQASPTWSFFMEASNQMGKILSIMEDAAAAIHNYIIVPGWKYVARLCILCVSTHHYLTRSIDVKSIPARFAEQTGSGAVMLVWSFLLMEGTVI
jgi:hypothetical protein